MFGFECTVCMVKLSCTQKPYRKSMMQLWGAYDAYLSGGLEDNEYPEENIRESLANLPKID